jgi:hypothetical protein
MYAADVHVEVVLPVENFLAALLGARVLWLVFWVRVHGLEMDLQIECISERDAA